MGDRALIEMTDGSDGQKKNYIAAILFLAWDGCDWLANASREEGGPWEISYRFRFYVDDKANDSNDVKIPESWRAKVDLSEDQIVAKLRQLGEVVTSRWGPAQESDFVDVRSDDPRVILQKLGSRPWAHLKMISGVVA